MHTPFAVRYWLSSEKAFEVQGFVGVGAGAGAGVEVGIGGGIGLKESLERGLARGGYLSQTSTSSLYPSSGSLILVLQQREQNTSPV